MEEIDAKYSFEQKRVAYERTRRHFLSRNEKWPFAGTQDFRDFLFKDEERNRTPIKTSVFRDKYVESLEGIKSYTPNSKVIWHPLDIEYFQTYPAPIMENAHRMHYTNVNSTITFFGPMLYYLIRALACEHVLEIGTAEGYSSLYIANAVKDNGTRYKMAGNMYYGVEILDGKVRDVSNELTKREIPNDIRVMDSINITKDTFKDVKFDLIFQDGAHDKEHVLYELETLYPQLKDKGQGYWIAHDIFGPCEEAYKIIFKQIKEGKYDFQYVTISEIYGLGIFRKMTGYDYDKIRWT